MRILELTYSVKPRGGVVHTLELARALAGLGHEVELAALARPGERFFRQTPCPTHLIEHVPDATATFDDRIVAMIDGYRDGLRPIVADRRYDVVHAQDCLSANAALGLRDEGLVDEVVRTVHHVDDFVSPSLIACQRRSIVGPDRVLCVSPAWVEPLRAGFGVDALVGGNGVDGERLTPPSPTTRAAARARLGLGERLTVLTIGGIEPRKGSLALVAAFARLRRMLPDCDPLLVVGGGATLFDYRETVDRFWALAQTLRVADHVRTLGPLTDDEVVAAYHAADLLAFPSTREGFGLVPLEALACGLPVVASDLDAFSEFLAHGRNALLVRPGDVGALATAMRRVATERDLRDRLRRAGRATAAAFDWRRVASRHEALFATTGVTG